MNDPEREVMKHQYEVVVEDHLPPEFRIRVVVTHDETGKKVAGFGKDVAEACDDAMYYYERVAS